MAKPLFRRSLFGSDDVIDLDYKPRDDDLLSKESLEAVTGTRDEALNYRERLGVGESSMLAHVTKVDTIARAKILKAEDGVLVARRHNDSVGYGHGATESIRGRYRFRNRAGIRRRYGGHRPFIDNTAVDEIVEYKPEATSDYVVMMDEINGIIMQPKYSDHLEYYPVGNPPLMKVFLRQMDETGPEFLAMILVIRP